jgi:hypothetical protein
MRLRTWSFSSEKAHKTNSSSFKFLPFQPEINARETRKEVCVLSRSRSKLLEESTQKTKVPRDERTQNCMRLFERFHTTHKHKRFLDINQGKKIAKGDCKVVNVPTNRYSNACRSRKVRTRIRHADSFIRWLRFRGRPETSNRKRLAELLQLATQRSKKCRVQFHTRAVQLVETISTELSKGAKSLNCGESRGYESS